MLRSRSSLSPVQAAASVQDLNRTDIAACRPPQLRYEFHWQSDRYPAALAIKSDAGELDSRQRGQGRLTQLLLGQRLVEF